MKQKDLNSEYIRLDFDVKSKELIKKHSTERGELFADLQNRGIISSSTGYQQILELTTKQVEEKANIYLKSIFETLDSNVYIDDDLKTEITKTVAEFIERLIQQDRMGFQQRLARDKIGGSLEKTQLRILESENSDVKEHFRKKAELEIRKWNRNLGSETTDTEINISQENKVHMQKTKSNELDIFISHSSHDNKFAGAMVDLFRTALNIPQKRIRCTSVSGYKLSTGANTDEQLRKEVYDAKVLIGVVTQTSMNSAYVLFELGARWGAGKKMFPVIASGADSSILGGPLKGITSVSCDNAADIHQLIDEIALELGIDKQGAASFQNKIEELVRLSKLAQTKKLSENHEDEVDDTYQIFRSQFLTFLRRFEADWISERDSEPGVFDSGIYIVESACSEVLDFRANIIQDDDSELTGILDEAARRLKSLQRYEFHMYDEFWEEGIQIIDLLKKISQVIDKHKGKSAAKDR